MSYHRIFISDSLHEFLFWLTFSMTVSQKNNYRKSDSRDSVGAVFVLLHKTLVDVLIQFSCYPLLFLKYLFN